MRILIIGAEGQVGSFLRRELAPRHEVHGTSLLGLPGLPALDIRDRDATLNCLQKLRPEQVVLTAALTHVDRCEERPDESEAINVRGTEHVARACRAVEAGLTFLSTDYIFDGRSGPYLESDPPHPLSVYGRHKLAGEQIVASWVDRHLIARTMVVYSYLVGTTNLFMQIYERSRKGEPVTQPNDQWVNPTQAVDLVKALAELIEAGQTGTFNLTGTTRLTRDDFARRVVKRLGLDPDLVRGVPTSDLRQKAPRPLNSGLVTDKAVSVLRTHRLWDLDAALDFTLGQVQAPTA